MKTPKKSSIIFHCLLMNIFLSPLIIYAQPCGYLNNFSSSVIIGPSQAPNTWYPDRYAPAGFVSTSSDIAGSASLKESISMADAAALRPVSQQSAFYNTQGRRIDLTSGIQSIEIKMYVPTAWGTSGKRMAGFWGEATDAGNANPQYPIVEFTSGNDADGMGPHFRGWEDGTGTWVNLGLPSGFAYNSWVTIRMALSTTTNQFTYTVGNNITYTTTSFVAGATKIGATILQGYNYNPAQPLDATNTGVSYDMYWDDFVQSTQTTGLAGFTVQDVNTGNYYCTIQSAINDASANDSITVAAGTYTEQLTINKSLSFSGAGVGECGTGSRPANETKLVAPSSGFLFNFSNAITVNFDGFEIDSANVSDITGASQNLAIRNSVFNFNFKPGSNNLYFSGNKLTLLCNSFNAISGTNDGSATHIFFAGNALNAINNSFTSVNARASMNASTNSLPVWINLTTGANNVNINHNSFSKIDLGILLAYNAGNIKIQNNEFSEAKRETLPFGVGMGAGIAIFQDLTPVGPIAITNNKFSSSEDGIRTSGSGANFPSSSLLKITYNSFESMSDAAIRVNGTYAGSNNNLNATCNWFGSILGPLISTNNGASGSTQLLDGGNKVTYKNWLNYGADADASQLGFQLPTSLTVTPGNNVSQAENQYRVLSNAIGCAVEGQTLTLSGTFDFSNSIAQTEWSKGNNGSYDNVGTVTGLGGDDYTITAPDSANNVTITATSLGSATILSPGDVDTVSLETPLYLDSRSSSSSHKKWTISNLIFNGFDVSILADNNGGNASVMDTFTVSNNRFYIPADWNATAKPKDNFQNIGINLNFGKGQTVTNNTFYVDGTGVSDIAGAKYSTSVVLQSNTSGGNIYDGLKITNNSIHVTGVPNASPARIIGLWENSNNQNAAIELSGNTFVNDDAGNLPAKNTQLAFRTSSFSGDATHQVVYKNNEVTGFNRGISFIGDPFSSYGPNTYYTGENPVVITNNKFDQYNVAVSIIKDPSSLNTGSPAIVNDNSFTHVIAGGFAIANGSSGTTPATCNWYDTLLVGNILSGSIAYLPRLSNGTDASASTGFQVDPSNTCVSPVLNVNTGNTYVTIQAAIDDPATLNGHSIQVGPGIYPENVTVNKSLNIFGTDSALVIVDKGNANYAAAGGNGFTITASNVTLSKMKVRNFDAGVNVTASVSNLLLDSLSLIENFDNGFFSNQAIDSFIIKKSTLSWNGNKNGTISAGSFKRGILTQSSAAVGDKYYILNNVTEYNGLVGIDVNLNKSLNGLVIDGNISRYNADEQIGAFLGNSDATMQPVSINNNTLVLSGSSRFGLELKMPHGSGLATGTGSVVVSNNNVSVAAGHLGSTRDMAAIAVIRRKDGYEATIIANDQPEGVVITGNTLSNFINATTTTSGSAFGIVVGGIAHKIYNNTISNTQISIQLQKGNENYNNNNDASSPAVPNNEYFDRDNSSDACAEIGTNTITSSSAARLVTAPSNVSTTPVQYVTNLSTTVKFCTIQTAIDFPTTVNGNTIDAAANTYTENVTVSKQLTIQGPNQTINPNTGSRVTEAIVVPATNRPDSGRVFNVIADNVTIKGFTIDGDNPTINGGTALNGADINAATGIGTGLYSSINGSSNLLIENNILQNFDNNISNTGAIYGNGSQNSAIVGNIFQNNKINNSNIWGILTESNYYASIQNNVITSANRGIQIDGFFIPAAGSTSISGNTVGYYKRGITINNSFGTASQFTVSSNTITAQKTGTNEDGGTGAVAANRGIAVWSMYSGTGGAALANNTISVAGYGMELWNNAAGKVTSTGDSVLNSTNIGILIPTQSTYGSAGYGSFATITQATLIDTTNNGISVIDNDGISGTPAQVNLTNSFVSGGVNNIAVTGPEIDASTAINNNSLTGASAKSIDASGYTGAAAINATCNWLGGPSDGYIASRISGNVTYLPALASGVDANPTTKGFQPAASCVSVFAKTIYVNDNSIIGDVYTTATGNDSNNGTSAAPFATISHAVDVAVAGDTLYVDAGSYVDTTSNISIVINKQLVIRGANAGVAPTDWINAPTTIYPQTSDPDVNSPTSTSIVYLTPTASGTSIDGLVIDGDNPALMGGININGANVDAIEAIGAYDGLSNVSILNNKVRNLSYDGIDFYNYTNGGAATSGNLIFKNCFDNILSSSYGMGILIYNNCYTSIVRNTMTRVSIGVQTGNFYQADTGNYHFITKNNIQSQVLGIWTNLHYANATNFVVRLDTLSNYASATPVQSMGIRVQSMQNNVGITLLDNTIIGNKYGVGLSNNPTTNTITVKGGSITGSSVAIWATNSFNTNNANAAPSIYVVDSVNIQNTSYAGVEVADTSLTTNGSSVAVAVTDYTIINNASTGLLLQGKKASASFTGTSPTPALFTGQSKYIDQITNSTNVPGTNIDATAVSFDGNFGSVMTLPTLYATEDKINHKIDADSLGFVLVKANNAYVTPASFITPITTAPKIQRGVNAASNGFTVNVEAGTYAENLIVNKQVTILGAQAGHNANTRFAAFNTLKADPTIESIVTTPTNNPSNGNPNANDLFRVMANNVTVDGFTFDGNNPALGASTVQDNNSLDIHARRALTNIDTLDNYNPVNSLIVKNNIIQNLADRAISLANNGPVSTGNSINNNIIRNYGFGPNGGMAVILFTNAYADITNNTISVPYNQIGLHLQNFFSNGTMTWSGNNITMDQYGLGIHANNFYAPAGILNINNDTVNMVPGAAPTPEDLTWGINVWSIQNGSSVHINNNTIGSTGGTFDRGINFWNMPTSSTVTVTGGSVANSVVGVNLDAVDPYYGAGSTSLAQITGARITGLTSAVRVRTSTLATPPYYAANTVSGSSTIMLSKDTINVSGTAKGVEIVAPAASTPYMATAYLTHGTLINNTTTSDTAVIINGNLAQLYADTSNIQIAASGAHNAIQFENITSGNTVSNLVLAGGTTFNLNANTTAKAFASPQYSIVEMDAPAAGWTAPDSTGSGNQSVLIDGAMKFTSGVLNSGNSIIEFGNDAPDIMTGSYPEKATSFVLGNAKMLARPVGNNALDMLGARLAAQTGTSADVGSMTVLRTTQTLGSINPAFPGNNSILTTWVITPSNTTSSRSDVEYRYLNTTANLNGQTPSSIYAYRYSGGAWNKISATLNSTLLNDVYTTSSFGVPGFSPWTLSSQSSLDAPDLTPIITVLPPSFTSATTSEPLNIKLFNIGTVATSGSGPITVYVLKPSTTYTNITLTNDANGTGGWTITDNGSFYTLTSTTSPVIASNNYISITGYVNTTTGIPAGKYTASASIANNAGGETNNGNNSAATVINVSN